MRIIDKSEAPADEKPATVARWYDHRARVWIVQTKDMHGNQIGEAGIWGTKEGAIEDEKERKAHF